MRADALERAFLVALALAALLVLHPRGAVWAGACMGAMMYGVPWKIFGDALRFTGPW
jgi:hypothetical protein